MGLQITVAAQWLELLMTAAGGNNSHVALASFQTPTVAGGRSDLLG